MEGQSFPEKRALDATIARGTYMAVSKDIGRLGTLAEVRARGKSPLNSWVLGALVIRALLFEVYFMALSF